MKDAGLVVVTGAGGFVGRHLVGEMLTRGMRVRAISRGRPLPVNHPPGLECCAVDDIVTAPWESLLRDARVIVHLAAAAHRANPRDDLDAQRVWAVNVRAVGELTRAASRAGVSRLILLSSIGVLGASSGTGAFDAASPPSPHDYYSRTKFAAERALQEAADDSPLQPCVVRAPLVFGPGAPGNFARLVTAIERGLPLPIAAVHNRRSLVSVWNLCDLLIACITHPRAPGTPLLVADDETLSTVELVRACASCLRSSPRLVYIPLSLLRLASRVLGRQEDFERLCGSLVVDTRATRERLGWQPPLTFRSGLARTLAGRRANA